MNKITIKVFILMNLINSFIQRNNGGSPIFIKISAVIISTP